MSQPAPQYPATAPLPAFDRRDFLWRTLARFDLYIGTTISRAAAVTALNALVVGGIVVKASDILGLFGAHPCARSLALGALAVATAASLASTSLSFLALVPYLGREPKRGTSAIFFVHVAGRTRDEHLKLVSELEGEAAQQDLAGQVHDMAGGLRRKFLLLHVASWITVIALLPSLAVLGTSVLYAVACGKGQ